jgi:hypothetical protein
VAVEDGLAVVDGFGEAAGGDGLPAFGLGEVAGGADDQVAAFLAGALPA